MLFPCLAALVRDSSTMLNRSDKSEHCLLPNLKRKTTFQYIEYYISCNLINDLSNVEVHSFYTLLRIFFIKSFEFC